MKIVKKLKNNLSNFFIIFFVFCLDRISKYLILKFFNTSEQQEIMLNSFITLNLIWNEGIAFGLFQFDRGIYYDLITLLIFAIILLVIWFAYNSNGINKTCYLILIGGGLGNVFDRIFYGGVIDFIDLHYKNFHWFIFNVADIFITLSILILIFLELKKQ